MINGYRGNFPVDEIAKEQGENVRIANVNNDVLELFTHEDKQVFLPESQRITGFEIEPAKAVPNLVSLEQARDRQREK